MTLQRLLAWLGALAVSVTAMAQSSIPPGPKVLVLGGVYHLGECPRLRGGEPVPTDLAQAIRSNIGPCPVCRPNAGNREIASFAANYTGAISREVAAAAAAKVPASGGTRIAPSAQTTVAILYVQEYPSVGAGGPITLTLASGARITIDPADLDILATALMNGARQTASAPSAPIAPVPPSVDTSQASIRVKCAKDWPDDFQMRAFCERQQRDAVTALRGRSMSSGDRATIRDKCMRDWPDDFQMRNFCEEQQLKALEALR